MAAMRATPASAFWSSPVLLRVPSGKSPRSDCRLDRAAVGCAAFHGKGVAAADRSTEDRILKEFDLCHVADRTIDKTRHQRRIDIARMIGGKDHGSLRRDVLASIDARTKDNVENQTKEML